MPTSIDNRYLPKLNKHLSEKGFIQIWTLNKSDKVLFCYMNSKTHGLVLIITYDNYFRVLTECSDEIQEILETEIL